jgi:16S rRNA (cytidine1402-2'-O)-methyltransferase
MKPGTGTNTGTLYVVATPIGNLSDMTPRAVQTLSEVDLVAAEDTRHSRTLFAHFKIKTPLFSCHAFNEEKKGDFFIRALLEGKNVALICDAGTPCISDPGYRLIRLAADADIQIVPVCGANAAVGALSVCGFDATRFAFIGFWPRNKKEQEETLSRISLWAFPVVFYESPKRIMKTLSSFQKPYPDTKICLCNDLTKKFERIYRGTPHEVTALLAENPDAQKGEYTCVVMFEPIDKNEKIQPEPDISLEALLTDLMIKENCDLKTAAAYLHTLLPDKPKKEIYAATLRLKGLFN